MFVQRLARTLPGLWLTLTLPGLWLTLTLPGLWLTLTLTLPLLLLVKSFEYLRHGLVAVLLVVQTTLGHGDEPGLSALVMVEQTHVDNVIARGVSAVSVELPQIGVSSQVQVKNVPRLMADGEAQVGITDAIDELVRVHGGHAVSRGGLDTILAVRHDSVFSHQHQTRDRGVVR